MENQNIVDLTKDMDMNVVLDTLNTMRDDVDGICKSDELRKFVYDIPVGYFVKNPGVEFTNKAKDGRYDTLSDKEYGERLEIVEAAVDSLGEKRNREFVRMDMRETYAKVLEAAAQLQNELKQIYDIAMFSKLMSDMGVLADGPADDFEYEDELPVEFEACNIAK